MAYSRSNRINQVIECANRPVFHIGKFPEMGRPALELHLFLSSQIITLQRSLCLRHEIDFSIPLQDQRPVGVVIADRRRDREF